MAGRTDTRVRVGLLGVEHKELEARGEEGAPIVELLARSADDARALPDWLVDSCNSAVCLPAGVCAHATAVQAECWAWALKPHPPDLIAISPTGSGKTLAFLVPALCHLLDRLSPATSAPMPATDVGKATTGPPASPVVLVLAPTRELCQQTATTIERIVAAIRADVRAAPFAPAASFAMACVYGGVDYRWQRSDLLTPASGHAPRLLVATPGRLLSLCGEMPESSRARQRAAAAPGGARGGVQGGKGGEALRGVGSGRPAGEAGSEEEALAPACSLAAVSLLVLDEADRLLDMGFEADLLAVRRLVCGGSGEQCRRADDDGRGGAEAAAGSERGAGVQSMLFSATWDARARQLASALMRPGAVHITVGGQALAAASTVEQRFEVMIGDQRKGAPRVRRLCAALSDFLGMGETERDGSAYGGQAAVLPASDDDDDEDDEEEEEVGEGGRVPSNATEYTFAGAGAPVAEAEGPRVIVFVLHKQQAKALARLLAERGFAAVPIHGNMSQSARAHSIAAFRSGRANVLVATDVAARGLDVSGVSHVVNFSLGGSLDMYVHRIGRCGRAGAKGVALSFVVDGDEPLLGALTDMLGRQRLPVPAELLELRRRWEAKSAKAPGAGTGGRHGRPVADGGRPKGGHASTGAVGGSGAARSANGGDDDDDDDELEARQANREKQLKMQQLKMQKERAQQKPTKHQGGRGKRR